MLVEKILDALTIQEPKVGDAGGTPCLACEVVEATHEPISKRQLEADLALR